MSIIKVDRVSKLYRTSEIETLALENVNFTIDKGEFVSVMGPSGCGKSTLLNIVGLLDKPTQGTVEIAGTDPTGLRDSKLAAFRNANIGFIFQNFHLIPSLNVADNVALPLLYRKNAPSGSKRQELIRDVLEKVGLTHRQRHYPSQLSGGQCQRVAIARAIIGNPSIILADEPTGNHGNPPQTQPGGTADNPDGDPQRAAGRRDRPGDAFLRRTSDQQPLISCGL